MYVDTYSPFLERFKSNCRNGVLINTTGLVSELCLSFWYRWFWMLPLSLDSPAYWNLYGASKSYWYARSLYSCVWGVHTLQDVLCTGSRTVQWGQLCVRGSLEPRVSIRDNFFMTISDKSSELGAIWGGAIWGVQLYIDNVKSALTTLISSCLILWNEVMIAWWYKLLVHPLYLSKNVLFHCVLLGNGSSMM